MENCRSPLLSWPYHYQGKSIEDLRQTLVYTTLELETTRLAAQEEIRKRDDQTNHLKEMLNRTMRERDEAEEKCQRLILEKLFLQQQVQQHTPASGISGIEQETPNRKGNDSNNGLSSSECEESIVSSPESDPILSPQLPESALRLIAGKRPLPEKGKLLQAVMKAGPLLQTLLLAGPLPQWKHPPPSLDPFEIPPVTIPTINPPDVVGHRDELLVSASNCRKRSYLEGDTDCDGSNLEANKYQRVLLH